MNMKNKIGSILREIFPDSHNLETINFLEEGLLDSFDVINIVTSLEEEFNIRIDGLDILPENFETLERIERLVEKYISK